MKRLFAAAALTAMLIAGAARGADAPKPDPDALIRANSYVLSYKDGKLSGPGADKLREATADAYSRTGRSLLHALSTSSDPVRTRSGLKIVPDTLSGAQRMDFELPALEDGPSADAFPKSIAGICRRYGPNTAYGVALNFEYPMTPETVRANVSETQ